MRAAELRRLAAIVPLLGLSGCLYVGASGTFGSHLDPAVIAQIQPGVSTKADVLRLLGPPEEFLRSEVLESLSDDETRIAGGVALGNRAQDAFSYQHDDVDGFATLLLLYNRVRARVESDLLVVFFDPDDRVREIGFRRMARQR
jgi:hypothetical protein